MTVVVAVAMAVAHPVAAVEPDPARELALRQLAQEAKAALDAGAFPRAADLYRQGWLLDPRDGGFLYGNARSLHLAGDLATAIVRYRAFLAMPDPHPILVERAQRYLAEAEATARAPATPDAPAPPAASLPEPATPVAAPVAVVLVADARPATAVAVLPQPGPAPWVLVGAGGLLTAAGAVAAAIAATRRSEFEAAMAPGLGGGQVTAYANRDAALADARAIARNEAWSWVTVGCGVTSLATGAVWLWWRDRGGP